MQGQSLPVYGEGLNVRDWLHVDDHAAALRLVLERGPVGEQYNIGGLNERRNIDLVQAICALLDECRPDAGLISQVRDRRGHDARYAIDAGKIRRELGWAPRERFETGLAKTIDWHLDNSAWRTRMRSGACRRQH